MRAQGGTTPDACPTTDVVGTCKVDYSTEDVESYQLHFHYVGGMTEEEARAQCTDVYAGEFTPG